MGRKKSAQRRTSHTVYYSSSITNHSENCKGSHTSPPLAARKSTPLLGKERGWGEVYTKRKPALVKTCGRVSRSSYVHHSRNTRGDSISPEIRRLPDFWGVTAPTDIQVGGKLASLKCGPPRDDALFFDLLARRFAADLSLSHVHYLLVQADG